MNVCKIAAGLLLAALALTASACAAPEPEPLPTLTPEPTATAYPTHTPSSTMTPATTPTPTPDVIRPWTLYADSYHWDYGEVAPFATLSKISSSGGVAGKRGHIPAVLNLECVVSSDRPAYWSIEIDWRGVISAADAGIMTVLTQFDGGNYRIEDWEKPDAHYNYLRAPYESEAAYILEFLQYSTFRLELQDGDTTTIWNEWDLRGLDEWINHPADLCAIAEGNPPQNTDATPAPDTTPTISGR